MQEDKVLGKRVEYPHAYCPEILVNVPRSLNREIYGIGQAEALFCGYDSWHAYEASFLLDNGMPVSGVLKVVYPANNRYIVESKSLKLYLGSFSMCPQGHSLKEAICNFTDTVKKDLGNLLDTEVECAFFDQRPTEAGFDFQEYQILENMVKPEQMSFSIYQENPAFLAEHPTQAAGELKVGSHLLKSNCKITNQPDWGSVYIRIKSNEQPSHEGLLKYIVSLRNENHFHEEICEMMFKRLTDLYQPEILAITCLYTRRGGIDICPARANKPEYLPKLLIRHDQLTQREFRQ